MTDRLDSLLLANEVQITQKANQPGLVLTQTGAASAQVVTAPAGQAGTLFGASGPGIYIGAGTPETFISAQIGSLYLNTTGNVANTTAYVKRTGAGTNTGWFPVTA